MAVLKIRKYGDPVLRQKAASVTEFDVNLAKFAADMIETMQAAKGIGLAAPQVGFSTALCIVDVGLIEEGAAPQVFVNPEILEVFGEEQALEEGCLSIPEVTDDVVRQEGIRLRYQDLEGQTHEIAVKGLFARVLQHEVDHLHGIFFTDRLSPFRRKMLAKKLRAISIEALAELREINRKSA